MTRLIAKVKVTIAAPTQWGREETHMKGLFDWLFDFDENGKLSDDEKIIGLSAFLGALAEEEENEDTEDW